MSRGFSLLEQRALRRLQARKEELRRNAQDRELTAALSDLRVHYIEIAASMDSGWDVMLCHDDTTIYGSGETVIEALRSTVAKAKGKTR